MRSGSRTPEEWGDVYADRKWIYEAFADRLEALLRDLLYDEELGYVETFSWTMTVDSFVSEIYVEAREGTPIDDPFARFGDVAGVTIVTRTKDSSESICALVERELVIDDDMSLSFVEAEERDPGIVGGGYPGRIYYDFPRLIASLAHDRTALAEWKHFDGLRAEIRIQTVLQRAWQQVDEDVLSYVWDSSYTEEAQQAITRVASSIARADDELLRVGGASREAERGHEISLGTDDLEIALDASALYVYLTESSTVDRLLAVGEDAGLRAAERAVDAWELEQRMLWLFRKSGITTLRELDDLLRSAEERAYELLGSIADIGADDGFVPLATPGSVVTWIILVLTRADADTVALTDFRSSIELALNTVIGNPLDTEGVS